MNSSQIEGLARSSLTGLRRPLRRAAVIAMLREHGLTEAEAIAVLGYALEQRIVALQPDGTLIAPEHAGPGTILFVEDDAEVRGTVSQVLEDEGYSVVHARDGKDALRKLAKGGRPNLILLDLIMPNMDGWELLSILKEDPELSSVPVVVLSAVADRAQDLGATVLQKPVDLGALLSTVSHVRAAA